MTKSYCNTPTTSSGKIAATQYLTSVSKFITDLTSKKCYCLVGHAEGFERHIYDKENLGFKPNQIYMVEKDKDTYDSLVTKQFSYPVGHKFHEVTILLGDIVEEVCKCKSGIVAHCDLDTSVTFSPSTSVGQIQALIDHEVQNLHLVWSTRNMRGEYKDYFPFTEWSDRWSNGDIKFLPPPYKNGIPKIMRNELIGFELYNLCPPYGYHGRNSMIAMVMNRKNL